MPVTPPFDLSPHQVLRGQGSDDYWLWKVELIKATTATSCLRLFYPELAEERSDEDNWAIRTPGTWQSLAYDMQYDTAVCIIAAFFSGPMWAYLLIRSPDDHQPLLKSPREVVQMAQVASIRKPLAPSTEREKSRMLYELEHGNPDHYPSEEHFERAKEWLEAAVLLSTGKEAVGARWRALNANVPLPGTVKLEVAQGSSLGEVPNSSARRRRRSEAEGSPEGPERRRIKLEP